MINDYIKGETSDLFETIDDLDEMGFFIYEVLLNTFVLSKGLCSILSIENTNNFSFDEFMDNYIHEDDHSLITSITATPSVPKFKFRFRLVDNFGFIRYVEASGKGIFDNDNNLIKYSGIIRDLSEEKYYEMRLKFADKLFSELINNSYQIVYSMSEDGYFTSCSSNAFKYLGYTVNEIIGQHQCIFTDDATNDILTNLRKKAIETGKPQELVDYKIYHKDGSVRLNTTTLFYIKDKYLNTGMFWGVVKDITTTKIIENKLSENDKKLKDREEWEKIKNEFIANISHELRTPVNVIYSSLQLFDLYIKNQDDLQFKGKISYYSKIMKQNCFRLLRLINNLIECSKFDAGIVNLETYKLDLVTLTASICSSVEEYTSKRNLTLNFNTIIPFAIIEGNSEKLEIVILNLLSNAIKFSKDCGTIDVSLYIKGKNVILSVKDNGIGISKDKQSKVFDRFIQADPLFTRTNEGSGIGLSVVKSLVETHNGTIDLISEENFGSEFIVTFPLIATTKNDLDKINRVIHTNHADQINIAFSDIYDN
ncbi:sensor histidine kinase [Clostridium senegalense]|uniref:histidine kinase n=1 Tax=Clostridium senegalense TaxID=1465809 RepID=A0A6M0H2M5_9CLOT|nr:PAS domain-containing sensor histidine kinase [Clostridium senegalense]NEU04787.1 PAS domain-containing sensor histidine kinase [Clostridium senegalense]